MDFIYVILVLIVYFVFILSLSIYDSLKTKYGDVEYTYNIDWAHQKKYQWVIYSVFILLLILALYLGLPKLCVTKSQINKNETSADNRLRVSNENVRRIFMAVDSCTEKPQDSELKFNQNFNGDRRPNLNLHKIRISKIIAPNDSIKKYFHNTLMFDSTKLRANHDLKASQMIQDYAYDFHYDSFGRIITEVKNQEMINYNYLKNANDSLIAINDKLKQEINSLNLEIAKNIGTERRDKSLYFDSTPKTSNASMMIKEYFLDIGELNNIGSDYKQYAVFGNIYFVRRIENGDIRVIVGPIRKYGDLMVIKEALQKKGVKVLNVIDSPMDRENYRLVLAKSR